MTPSRSESSARNISVIPWKNKNVKSQIQEGYLGRKISKKIISKSDVSKSYVNQLHARFSFVPNHRILGSVSICEYCGICELENPLISCN